MRCEDLIQRTASLLFSSHEETGAVRETKDFFFRRHPKNILPVLRRAVVCGCMSFPRFFWIVGEGLIRLVVLGAMRDQTNSTERVCGSARVLHYMY